MHQNVSAIFTKIIYLILPKYWLFGYVNFVITVPLTLIFIHYVKVFLERVMPEIAVMLGGSRSLEKR